VQEIDVAWENALRDGLAADYPFIHAIPDDFNFGIMLLSKIAPKDLKVDYTTDFKMPYYEFSLDYKSKNYHFVGMHTYPPSSASKLPWRNDQLALLAKLSKTNTVLMGDFNTATFSPAFRRLLRDGKLQDPRKQAGILNTWPARFPFLGSNIDHILVGKDLHYGKLKRLADIGSDHLPLILQIR
jgi:endonuclease/exonuclease/phosphatase family metal-dependent hydrolase